MHAATTDALARALGVIVRDVEQSFQQQLAVFKAQQEAIAADLRADLAEARQQRDALAAELRETLSARLAEVKDGADGKEGPSGRDGADGAPGDPGRDGASVTLDDVMPELRAQVDAFLRDLPPPQDGAPGRDGDPGKDGRSVNPRGTFDPEQDYEALDVVVLGGSSFMAVKDAPGPCPGGGWQLLASRGSRGEKGLRGEPGRDGIGIKGDKGDPGEGIAAFYRDGGDLVITTDSGAEHRLVQK